MYVGELLVSCDLSLTLILRFLGAKWPNRNRVNLIN